VMRPGAWGRIKRTFCCFLGHHSQPPCFLNFLYFNKAVKSCQEVF
jgi:hypothetical protein